MKIQTCYVGGQWVVKFSHGVQTFTLDYKADEEQNAAWMAEQLKACFDNAFENTETILYTGNMSLPEWLSKERCAVAGNIWRSHQQGDNKRIKAILQIKKWAAEAGYQIGIKKANELFKQHCL